MLSQDASQMGDNISLLQDHAKEFNGEVKVSFSLPISLIDGNGVITNTKHTLRSIHLLVSEAAHRLLQFGETKAL